MLHCFRNVRSDSVGLSDTHNFFLLGLACFHSVLGIAHLRVGSSRERNRACPDLIVNVRAVATGFGPPHNHSIKIAIPVAYRKDNEPLIFSLLSHFKRNIIGLWESPSCPTCLCVHPLFRLLNRLTKFRANW
jgi:hypothetical protein